MKKMCSKPTLLLIQPSHRLRTANKVLLHWVANGVKTCNSVYNVHTIAHTIVHVHKCVCKIIRTFTCMRFCCSCTSSIVIVDVSNLYLIGETHFQFLRIPLSILMKKLWNVSPPLPSSLTFPMFCKEVPADAECHKFLSVFLQIQYKDNKSCQRLGPTAT